VYKTRWYRVSASLLISKAVSTLPHPTRLNSTQLNWAKTSPACCQSWNSEHVQNFSHDWQKMFEDFCAVELSWIGSYGVITDGQGRLIYNFVSVRPRTRTPMLRCANENKERIGRPTWYVYLLFTIRQNDWVSTGTLSSVS